MKQIIKYKNHILGISVLVVVGIVLSVVSSKSSAFLSSNDKTFTSIITSPVDVSGPQMETVSKSSTQFADFVKWLDNEGKNIAGNFSVKFPEVKAVSLMIGGQPRIAEVFPAQPDFADGLPKYGVTPWIEIRNFGNSPASINGWKIKSINNGWTATITQTAPLSVYPIGDYSEYFVLCQDKIKFDTIYSNLTTSPNILDCDMQIPGQITAGDKYILLNTLGVVKQQVSINIPIVGGAPRSIEIDQTGLNIALSPVPYGRPGYRLRLGDANESQSLLATGGITAGDLAMAQNQLAKLPQDPATPPPLLPYQIHTIRGWQNVIAVSQDVSVLSTIDLVGISACLILGNNCSMVDFSLQN